jgi:hypothetical protein
MMANRLFDVRESGELRLNFHKYQWQAMFSCARHTYLLKGWRAGFSSFAPFWLKQEMTRCGPGNPALRYAVIAPTLSGMKEGLLPEMVRVFVDYLKLATHNKNKNEMTITPAGDVKLWGHRQKERTVISFCYAENPESFASMTALGFVADEIGQTGFKLESFRTMLARMGTTSGQVAPGNISPDLMAMGFPKNLPSGRLLAGSTVYQLGWLEDIYNEWRATYAERMREWRAVYQEAESDEERLVLRERYRALAFRGMVHRKTHFIRFDSTANPTYNKEDYEADRKSLPKWFFDMKFRAIFRKPAGAIFEGWEPSRHVVAPFEIPESWPREVAIDFGKRNFYATFWAWDKERDRHFLYQSYHDSQKSNEERAEEILRLEPDISWCVAGQVAESDARVELALGGIPAIPPLYRPVWEGIHALGAMISQDKIFVFRGACPGIEDEFKSYARPVDDQGQVKLDADPVNKETYHWIDSARYRATWRGRRLAHGVVSAPRKSRKVEAEERAVAKATGRPRDVPILNEAQQISHIAATRPMTPAGAIRFERYGLRDEGCYEPHLDI